MGNKVRKDKSLSTREFWVCRGSEKGGWWSLGWSGHGSKRCPRFSPIRNRAAPLRRCEKFSQIVCIIVEQWIGAVDRVIKWWVVLWLGVVMLTSSEFYKPRSFCARGCDAG